MSVINDKITKDIELYSKHENTELKIDARTYDLDKESFIELLKILDLVIA